MRVMPAEAPVFRETGLTLPSARGSAFQTCRVIPSKDGIHGSPKLFGPMVRSAQSGTNGCTVASRRSVHSSWSPVGLTCSRACLAASAPAMRSISHVAR